MRDDLPPLLICDVRPDGGIEYANDAWAKLIGQSSSQLAGRNLRDLAGLNMEHERFEALAAVTPGRPCVVIDLSVQSPGGERHQSRWVFRGQFDDQGSLVLLLGVGEDVTDRAAHQPDPRGFAERLAPAFAASGTGVWEWVVSTDTVSLEQLPAEVAMGENPRTESYPTLESWLTRVHADHRPRVKAVLTAAANDETPLDVGFRYLVRSGAYRWQHLSGQAVRGEQGKTVRIVGCVSDVDCYARSARLLETQLRLSEFARSHSVDEVLQRFLDEAEALTDSEIGFFHFVEADQSMLQLQMWSTNTLHNMCTAAGRGAHYPMSEAGVWVEGAREKRPVIHNDYASLPNRKGLPEGHAPVIRELVVPVLAGDKVKAILGVGNKRTDYVESDVATVTDIANLAWDIVERKRSEEALRESEEKYRSLFQGVMDAIVLGDASSGLIVDCNEAAVEMFGWRRDELIGRPFAELYPQGCSQIASYSEVPRGALCASCKPCDCQMVTADGTVRVTSVRASRFSFQGRSLICWVIRDTTETRRLQELEARALRLETAGKIAGQVAHDFNNLLGPLMAYPEIIREELPKDHPSLTMLKDMERAAERIADINQELLTLGRRGHYNLEPLSMNEVISEVVRSGLKREDGVTVVTDLYPDLLNIKGGRAQLTRVMLNMLQNALDAVGQAGRIEVATANRYVELDTTRYDHVPRGEYVEVTVADNGCGIPAENVDQIFDPFFSSKTTDRRRGTGLGLSVVDAVIRDHGGFVDVESQPGAGTTFTLYLPATREAAEQLEEEALTGGDESVLVVDDDPGQREVTVRLLQRLGYRAASAESGERAVELIRAQPYDLVILDMVMPGGMDGADTYREIAMFRPGQRALVVSGFSESDRVAEARRAGAGAFERKPLTLRTLARAVRTELDCPARVEASRGPVC